MMQAEARLLWRAEQRIWQTLPVQHDMLSTPWLRCMHARPFVANCLRCQIWWPYTPDNTQDSSLEALSLENMSLRPGKFCWERQRAPCSCASSQGGPTTEGSPQSASSGLRREEPPESVRFLPSCSIFHQSIASPTTQPGGPVLFLPGQSLFACMGEERHDLQGLSLSRATLCSSCVRGIRQSSQTLKSGELFSPDNTRIAIVCCTSEMSVASFTQLTFNQVQTVRGFQAWNTGTMRSSLAGLFVPEQMQSTCRQHSQEVVGWQERFLTVRLERVQDRSPASAFSDKCRQITPQITGRMLNRLRNIMGLPERVAGTMELHAVHTTLSGKSISSRSSTFSGVSVA